MQTGIISSGGGGDGWRSERVVVVGVGREGVVEGRWHCGGWWVVR